MSHLLEMVAGTGTTGLSRQHMESGLRVRWIATIEHGTLGGERSLSECVCVCLCVSWVVG